MSLTHTDSGIIINKGEVIYEPNIYSLLKNQPELIKSLPKHFFLDLPAIDLQRTWSKLPENLKEDKDLLERLPCFEHYNRPEDIVHIDGPPPPKYRCYVCTANKRMLKK